jgi:hypothetical protein
MEQLKPYQTLGTFVGKNRILGVEEVARMMAKNPALCEGIARINRMEGKPRAVQMLMHKKRFSSNEVVVEKSAEFGLIQQNKRRKGQIA